MDRIIQSLKGDSAGIGSLYGGSDASESNLVGYASVTASGYYGTQVPTYATDNNDSTRWATDLTNPNWLKLDFSGTARLVGRAEIYDVASTAGSIATSPPRDFQLQASNDGNNWDVLFYIEGKTSWAGGAESFSIPLLRRGRYRYYRLMILRSNYSSGTTRASIHTLKLYGV